MHVKVPGALLPGDLCKTLKCIAPNAPLCCHRLQMEMPWPHNFSAHVRVCVQVLFVSLPNVDGSQVRVLQRAIDLLLANIHD